MPKSDDKGEPVKIVRIGGREVEVPIIFVLPEEAGEKEIERYEHPKVNIKKEDKAAESEEESLEELTDGKLEEVEKPSDEEETPYLDMLSDKPKRKKKPVKVSYRSLFDKGYGKAQALRRSVEEQKKRGAKTDDELAAEAEKKVPKGQHGMLNYDYLSDKPDEKDYLTDEEGDEIEKSWERWLKQKEARSSFDKQEEISGSPKDLDTPHTDSKRIGGDTYSSVEELDNIPFSLPQSHVGQSTAVRDEAEEGLTYDQAKERIKDPTTLKSWEKWLQKKQTRIDRKQEWGDKSKIGIGSWEDRPELKPKGRFDKDGKRIRERGQGEAKPREGAL